MDMIAESKAVFEHLKEIVPEIKDYFGILALFGALKTGEAAGDPTYIQKTCKLLERFPDEVSHTYYNIKSYAIGGIARAYALFKGYMTDEKTKKLVWEYAEELMTAPRDDDGLIKSPYVSPRNLVWIDCAMAVTPFLLYAGLALGEKTWINEAVFQTLGMYDVFSDPQNGLLHQSRGEIAEGVLSDDHWGRGNGWGYIALTELLEYLPENHPERRRVCICFGRHSHALLMCQSENFVWRQELDCPTSYEEASATGLILYGFGVGLRLGYLHPHGFEKAFENGILAMRQIFIKEGYQIHFVCPGCRTPGMGKEMGQRIAYLNKFPEVDDLHGFGPLQLAFSEAAKK